MAWWLLLSIGVLADLQLPVVDLVPWCHAIDMRMHRWDQCLRRRAIGKKGPLKSCRRMHHFCWWIMVPRFCPEILIRHSCSLQRWNPPPTLRHRGLGNSSSGFWGKALSASQQLFALPETSKAQVAAGKELREFLNNRNGGKLANFLGNYARHPCLYYQDYCRRFFPKQFTFWGSDVVLAAFGSLHVRWERKNERKKSIATFQQVFDQITRFNMNLLIKLFRVYAGVIHQQKHSNVFFLKMTLKALKGAKEWGEQGCQKRLRTTKCRSTCCARLLRHWCGVWYALQSLWVQGPRAGFSAFGISCLCVGFGGYSL